MPCFRYLALWVSAWIKNEICFFSYTETTQKHYIVYKSYFTNYLAELMLNYQPK